MNNVNSDYAVVPIESTNPYAGDVAVNPVRSPRGGLTYLVDPEESEEATEPFLSQAPRSCIRTGTELNLLGAYTTTEEDPHVRWRLPSSLLATG